VLDTSPAASIPIWCGFLREVVDPRAQQVVSEYPRFVVGSCVDSKGISCCLEEIVCPSRSSVGTACEIVCRSKNSVWIAREINSEE